jgi:hypothetical protein
MEETMTPTEELNRRFAKLCGIPWFEDEGHWGDGYKLRANPDFCADPRLVLKEMDKLNMLDKFIVNRYLHRHPMMLVHGILDETGLLCEAACEFLKQEAMK